MLIYSQQTDKTKPVIRQGWKASGLIMKIAALLSVSEPGYLKDRWHGFFYSKKLI